MTRTQQANTIFSLLVLIVATLYFTSCGHGSAAATDDTFHPPLLPSAVPQHDHNHDNAHSDSELTPQGSEGGEEPLLNQILFEDLIDQMVKLEEVRVRKRRKGIDSLVWSSVALAASSVGTIWSLDSPNRAQPVLWGSWGLAAIVASLGISVRAFRKAQGAEREIEEKELLLNRILLEPMDIDLQNGR